MILDIFFTILSGLFQTIAFVLSPLNWVVPPTFVSGLLYLFNYLNYFSGVINLPVLAACIILLISFDTLFYGYKIVLFLIHLTPWIGNPSHPKVNAK